jgi:hypothetical protein
MQVTKKALPVFVVLAAMALFLLPGLALGGHGEPHTKCPSPSPRGSDPPSEDPARKCGHPQTSGTSETATSETATSETATSETATSETATSETATSETATSETATTGVECTGFVHLGDNEIIAAPGGAPLIEGLLGVHIDALPGADEQVSIARACVGLGSAAVLGVDCEGPLVVEPRDSDGLFVCVEV